MTEDVHERAVRLVFVEQVEGLSAADRTWLEAHLAACAGCSAKAEALGRAITSIRSVSVQLNPALLEATRRRVRSRAAAIEEQRHRLRVIGLATTLSLVWMAFTGLLMWRGFEWLGRGWPDSVWQTTFVLGWFLPATVVALALALMRGERLRRLES